MQNGKVSWFSVSCKRNLLLGFIVLHIYRRTSILPRVTCNFKLLKNDDKKYQKNSTIKFWYKQDVRYFPKGFFLVGNFPRLFSHVTTSQVCPKQFSVSSLFEPRRSASQPILAATLGPHCRGSNLTWEVAAWVIARLGSCQLGSRSCENAFGKVPADTIHRNRLRK